MKLQRAFTLIELLIAIVILSMIMTFLYRSYASLNLSNKVVAKELKTLRDSQKLREVLLKDVMLSLYDSFIIKRVEVKEDFVSFETRNSLYKRYNPYVTYLVKDTMLYRLESLDKMETKMDNIPELAEVDKLGEVKSFRFYKANIKEKNIYLIHIDFVKQEDILLKIRALNEL